MGVSVLRGQGVGLPTVKVSFWPGVRSWRLPRLYSSITSKRYKVLPSKTTDFARLYWAAYQLRVFFWFNIQQL